MMKFSAEPGNLWRYNVSFFIDEGELVVVMGLSGSGKSTSVRCINNLVVPTLGRVLIDNVDVGALSPKDLRTLRQKKLGMVFQSVALFPHYTVLQNVEFGLEVMKVAPKIRREKALETLSSVGLEAWAQAMPGELSGGMQQRVGLARALDILLMDEAFSALDPLIRRDMQDELLLKRLSSVPSLARLFLFRCASRRARKNSPPSLCGMGLRHRDN